MNINWIGIGKHVVEILTSAGIGAVVRNAIAVTTPPGLSIVNKVLTVVGEVAVTGVLATKGSEYMVDQYEKLVTSKNKKAAVQTLTESKS